MGNSVTGSYATNRTLTMAAYDKLPPELRAVFRDALDNYVPQPFVTQLRRGIHGPAALAKLLIEHDKKELQKREKQRAKAQGPYKGNVPVGV